MLGKESVRNRVQDGEQGLSLTEFSYVCFCNHAIEGKLHSLHFSLSRIVFVNSLTASPRSIGQGT